MEKAYYAGIDVGGTKVALGIFDEDKVLLGKYKFPSDSFLSGEDFFREVVAQAEAADGTAGTASWPN